MEPQLNPPNPHFSGTYESFLTGALTARFNR